MAAGVLLHLTIFANMAVGLFSPSMFVLYLAFIPPEVVQKLPQAIRQSATRLLARVRRRRFSLRETTMPHLEPDEHAADSANVNSADGATAPVAESNAPPIMEINGRVPAKR
jgi:hypothetical protein